MTTATMVILLVEDQPTDVLLVRRAFSRANPSTVVHTAADGDTAVAYLCGEGEFADRKRHPFPKLLLLDLKLPRRSGLEVLDWIRKHARMHQLPVIVLTSSSEMSDINQAYNLGANSYLCKPTAFEDLLALVRTIDEYWVRWNLSPAIEAPG